MASPTSPHWNRMQYLRDRIHDRQMLRDAQVQNSVDYQGFQREIDHLTRELLHWENKASYIAGHWWRLAVGPGSSVRCCCC